MSSIRDDAETARSASEARKIKFRKVALARYRNPPADTCFPLESAFHLLGDMQDKLVVDLGCGFGEEVIPLRPRGALVIGIDISPELINIAKLRVQEYGLQAELKVGSAYDTGLES